MINKMIPLSIPSSPSSSSSSSGSLKFMNILLLLFIITIQLSSTTSTTNTKINNLIHQLKSSNNNNNTTTTRSTSSRTTTTTTNDSDERIVYFNFPPIGTLKGIESPSQNYKAFKSIPYALPPVGSRRWQPPVPLPTPTNNTNTILDTTQFGPMCPQLCLLPHGLCAQNQSEDCLTLNVYTPYNNSSSSNLPVMVFFPGGHFDQGTANCPLYDGRYFVSKGNVILVTVNYRLGALGYLVSLSNNIKGNFALKDQRLALQFIQQSIHYFGGNPNQVTIFGESAGASSVTSLIQNKASRGLFHQAIFQSNPLSLPFRDLKSLDSLGQRFISESKCTTLDCLKQLNFNEIVQLADQSSNHLNILHPIISFMPWTPCLDGSGGELEEEPLQAFKNGNYFTNMPIMMGTCSEEAIMFIYLALSSPLNSIEYDGALLGLFGVFDYFKVHKYYPPNGPDQRVELSILGTDYIFTAATRNALSSIYNTIQSNLKNNLYLFEFNHTLSFSEPVFKQRYPFCVGHVCHGSELPLLFHSSQYVDLYLNAEEEILSHQMIEYWTNFAYTGNPNNPGSKFNDNKREKNNNSPPTLPLWNNFTPNNLLNMEFQTPKSFMVQGLRKQKMDMFDDIGYHHGY